MGLASFLGLVEKAPKVVDCGIDVIKQGMGGIDMLFNTEEEKAIYNAQMGNKIMDYSIEMAKIHSQANSESSKARRWLMKFICKLYATAFLTALIFACWQQFVVVNAIIDVIAVFKLGWAFATAVIAFLGYYGFNKYQTLKKK